MYLITGSTGNIGRRVVELLHANGHEVRALVRSAERAKLLPSGIEIAIGDLDDTASLESAVHGVSAVFLLHAGQGTSQTKNMIEVARHTALRRIVLLSSIGAKLRPLPIIGATLAAREDLLRSSGLDVTYLRPNTLMSNTLAWADGIRANSRVIDPTGPGRMPCVDPDDIARVAALALTEHGHVGRGYILNGPEALTSREQVNIIADLLGREIAFDDIEPEAMERESVQNGSPIQAAAAMRNLHEMFRIGRAGVIADDIENLTGVAPRDFRSWCEGHLDEFR